MKKKIWTEEELSTLVEFWPASTKSEIQKLFPDRTYASVVLKASGLKIGKAWNGSHPYVKADLSRLLQETPEAYYWMGFLAADGSFVGDRLKLGLSPTDREQVEKFCEFIRSKNVIFEDDKVCEVKILDKYQVPLIKNKFGMNQAKTYNPPSCDVFANWGFDLFVSFLIGFIDGDGHVSRQTGGRPDCSISIKLHSSWLKVLQYFSDTISNIVGVKPPLAKINNSGYANVNFANNKTIVFLKKQVVSKNLAVLKRKWSIVDENFVGRNEKFLQNRKIVLSLLKEGHRITEIAKRLKVSYAYVWKVREEQNESLYK